jgi:hypothetical protein
MEQCESVITDLISVERLRRLHVVSMPFPLLGRKFIKIRRDIFCDIQGLANGFDFFIFKGPHIAQEECLCDGIYK